MKLTYEELVDGARRHPRAFLRRVALKGSVSFPDTDPLQLPKRDLITLAVLLVGNVLVSYQGNSNHKRYTLLHVPLLALKLIYEHATNRLRIQRQHRAVHYWSEKLSTRTPRRLSQKSGGRLLYLRTDLLGQTREGGSFTHVAGFIAGAEQLGWQTTLVACGELPAQPSQAEVVPYTPFVNTSMETAEMDYSFRLAKQLEQRTPFDCIYQRHSGFNLTGLLLAEAWNVPFVLEVNNLETWIRDNWGTQKGGQLLEDTERLLFQAADLIVVVSEVLKEDMVRFGVSTDKILVNPNGVEEDLFRPDAPNQDTIRERYGLAPDDTLVGFIGSFGVWHGVPVLAEAVPKVRKKSDKVSFLLIGDGELRPEQEKKLQTYVADHSVVFTGRIPHHEAPAHLAACDILASPHVPNADGTRFFGSPTKLFEYMAMERAIVASNLEQIGQILRDGQDAVLTKPGDSGELAEAILALAKNPKQRLKLAKAARAKALAEYTWKANADHVFNRLRA